MRTSAASLLLLITALISASHIATAGSGDKTQSTQTEPAQTQPADTAPPSSSWYASIAPNEELTSPVFWANTKDEAMAGALRVCQKVSSTCSTRPAWTDTQADLFAIMCCQKPKLGCAIGVGANEDLARQHVRNIFSEAGYSKCKPAKFLSARTGEEVEGR
ncbi:MAG: hypothetical protein AB7S70_15750 [Hyphomicrobium sp.]|uniref:hypothetical protein n=1 Tax=Hyphomicrobium sp. TaxID=82 RepID=UPI003D0E5671